MHEHECMYITQLPTQSLERWGEEGLSDGSRVGQRALSMHAGEEGPFSSSIINKGDVKIMKHILSHPWRHIKQEPSATPTDHQHHHSSFINFTPPVPWNIQPHRKGAKQYPSSKPKTEKKNTI